MLPDVNVLVSLLWRSSADHEVAHHWLGHASEFYTTPDTEMAALRISIRYNPQVPVPQIRASLGDVLAHPKRRAAADAALPLDEWPFWRHLTGHSLVNDFWLAATAERLGMKVVTTDKKLMAGLPAPLRQRFQVISTR